jgi:hypothetical protein
LRAQLGNDLAIKAFREGNVPFPDGAIIAAIHWTNVPSEDNDKVLSGAFPGAQSFVVGSAVNVQFMVKDSKELRRYGRCGGSLTLPTANLAARRCTIPASPATRRRKIAIMSSPVTHLRAATAGRVHDRSVVLLLWSFGSSCRDGADRCRTVSSEDYRDLMTFARDRARTVLVAAVGLAWRPNRTESSVPVAHASLARNAA